MPHGEQLFAKKNKGHLIDFLVAFRYKQTFCVTYIKQRYRSTSGWLNILASIYIGKHLKISILVFFATHLFLPARTYILCRLCVAKNKLLPAIRNKTDCFFAAVCFNLVTKSEWNRS